MMLAANMFLAGIGPYIDPVSVEGAAKIIAIHTSCDSLAEENQRLRGALQLLANGSNPLGGLPYQSWVRHTAREGLKAKSDKASFPAD